MLTGTDHRTLGDLFGELSRETRTLIQQELLLAKIELAQTASQAGRNAGLITAGALVLYGGLLTIIAAVVLGLIRVGLTPWAGALVGGIMVAGLGFVLVRTGLSGFRRLDFVPRQTIATLKEDATWLKTQIK